MSSLATPVLARPQNNGPDNSMECTGTRKPNSLCNPVVELTNENDSSLVLETDKGDSDLQDVDGTYSNADLRLLYPLGF